MDLASAKIIGAAVATIAMAGVSFGLSSLFSAFVSGALRNPSAAEKVAPNLLLGAALVEALGIFCLLIALLIIFN